METLYNPGTIWELETNAQLVPRGVYTLVAQFGEVLVFQVGRDIQFTLVERFYRAFLRQTDDQSKPLTSAKAFLARYESLRKKPSSRLCGGLESMSFVFMDPSLVGHLVKSPRALAQNFMERA